MKNYKSHLLVIVLTLCSIISSFSSSAVDDADIPDYDDGGELVCSTSYSFILVGTFPPSILVIGIETCNYQ